MGTILHRQHLRRRRGLLRRRQRGLQRTGGAAEHQRAGCCWRPATRSAAAPSATPTPVRKCRRSQGTEVHQSMPCNVTASFLACLGEQAARAGSNLMAELPTNIAAIAVLANRTPVQSICATPCRCPARCRAGRRPGLRRARTAAGPPAAHPAPGPRLRPSPTSRQPTTRMYDGELII
jgi:hypothetical protein